VAIYFVEATTFTTRIVSMGLTTVVDAIKAEWDSHA